MFLLMLEEIEMVRIDGAHTRNHSIKLVHGPSKKQIITTPPLDNGGTGDSFSPTDLLAASYGACMLTIMSLHAVKKDLDLEGARFHVDKHMTAAAPRRIEKLQIEFFLPDSVPMEDRQELEEKALHCPVALSIGEQVLIETNFSYQPK
jgi:uncharacterized OsmC-like protein